MHFTVKKGSEKAVSRRGSEKAVSRRCLERPLEEYAPLGVRPLEVFPLFLLLAITEFGGPDRRLFYILALRS